MMDSTMERYARMLASGHQFVQSVATENVCGECGAHKEFHAADAPVVVRRPPNGLDIPRWSFVGFGNLVPDNVRAHQLQGRW